MGNKDAKVCKDNYPADRVLVAFFILQLQAPQAQCESVTCGNVSHNINMAANKGLVRESR